MRLRVLAALAAACALAAPAAAFTPSDPLAPRQWYLAASHAYDAWPELPTTLQHVRVAIVDSGVDLSHPELRDHVVAKRSFVGGKGVYDSLGHGTFVAGVVAATVNDGVGTAGMFPTADLIVAKVVTGERTISPEAEAVAIRWAVNEGARVINLSFGGVRDPLHPRRNAYSQAEADAVAYAVSRGVVVVAAVGNGDQAPAQPWRFASYPAALPHVLGVSAYAQDGSSPDFSNRDAIYNDIAAPGTAILSTFPQKLTAERPACPDQGYSSCGSEEYLKGEGTSFAAPQVTAAAAMLIATNPGLSSDQVTTILEQSAADANAGNGCRRCPRGRDAYTGWGRLDVATAIASLGEELPQPDAFEPNDDSGSHARLLRGSRRTIHATVDFWDDQSDVYAIPLQRGQRLDSVLSGPSFTDTALVLWKPRTPTVESLATQGMRARVSDRPGSSEHIFGFRARRTGTYYLQVKIASADRGAYKLQFAKS
jgi:subtilisin family serine protease